MGGEEKSSPPIFFTPPNYFQFLPFCSPEKVLHQNVTWAQRADHQTLVHESLPLRPSKQPDLCSPCFAPNSRFGPLRRDSPSVESFQKKVRTFRPRPGLTLYEYKN